MRSIGGEGRKEGRDKRGGDRRCVIYLAARMTGGDGPTSRIDLPFALSPAALRNSSKRQADALSPGSGDRARDTLARVAFDDDDDD